jgi:hypothetical protein
LITGINGELVKWVVDVGVFVLPDEVFKEVPLDSTTTFSAHGIYVSTPTIPASLYTVPANSAVLAAS